MAKLVLFHFRSSLSFPINLIFSFHFSLQNQPHQILLSCLGIGNRQALSLLGACLKTIPTTPRAKGSDGNYSSERKTMSPSEANRTALAPCCSKNWRSHQAEHKNWQVNQINWCSSMLLPNHSCDYKKNIQECSTTKNPCQNPLAKPPVREKYQG